MPWTASETITVMTSVSALVTAIVGGLIAIIAAIHGAKNSGKTEVLSQRVDSQSQSIRDNRNAITQTALATPGGGAGAGTAANPLQAEIINTGDNPVPTTDTTTAADAAKE